VRARIAELQSLLVRHFITPAGGMHYLLHLDLAPVPSLERYGYILQLPVRLAAAAAVVGGRDEALELGYRCLEHVLERGWDRRAGAFITAGPAAPPDAIGEHSLRVADHEWWVQTEALRSLVQLSLLERQPERYREWLAILLETVEREFIDRRRGGWHYLPVGDLRLRRRLSGEPVKGDHWKDASHEADAYLAAVRMLRGLAEDAPIG